MLDLWDKLMWALLLSIDYGLDSKLSYLGLNSKLSYDLCLKTQLKYSELSDFSMYKHFNMVL